MTIFCNPDAGAGVTATVRSVPDSATITSIITLRHSNGATCVAYIHKLISLRLIDGWDMLEGLTVPICATCC